MRDSYKISVIGAGAWGTTIANILAQNGFKVQIWAYSEATATAIRNRQHPSLEGVRLEAMEVTQELEACADADYLVIGLASKQFDVLSKVDIRLFKEKPVLILTKGLNQTGANLFISDELSERLQTPQIAVLSGPNLALEIAREKPAASVVASHQPELAQWFQVALTRPYFRVYTQADLRGVECGGILKNVIAIAAGISDGLDLGQNAKAALLTRGLIEMERMTTVLGGQSSTIYGLSGLADLMATAHSELSRNWNYGYRWVKGGVNLSQVVEGVKTVERLKPRLDDLGCDAPILKGVYEILMQGVDPKKVVSKLFSRELKAEYGRHL